MNYLNYFFQAQDTIQKKEIRLNTNSLATDIQVERKNIELSEIRSLQVDSARIPKPKKYIPVIKTVPFVPKSDTIAHPSYNAFKNTFVLSQPSNFFDNFNVNPLNPDLSNAFVSVKTKDNTDESIKESFIEIPVKNDLRFVEKEAKSKGFGNTDWMLGIIIFLWVIFGWLRVGFGRYFQNAIQASYNYFAARRIQDEANVLRSRVFYFMNVLFFMCLSLFITQWFDFNNYNFFEIKSYLLFLFILLALIIIYSFKSMFLLVLDFLFLAKGNFSAYNTTVFIYNKLTGFILLPIVSILPYVPSHIVPWIFKGAVFVIVLIYSLRIFRGLLVGFKIRLSIFYLILYLCALEILPVLMLYKVVSSFI